MDDERPPPIVCDAEPFAPEIGSIELLARLVMVARSVGADYRIDGASPELRDLVRLCGLGSVIRL
jgi:hypothetical protein